MNVKYVGTEIQKLELFVHYRLGERQTLYTTRWRAANSAKAL